MAFRWTIVDYAVASQNAVEFDRLLAPPPGERKVFDRSPVRQQDCSVEECADGGQAKHNGLMLGDPSQADDSASLGEMSSPLPVEHADMKLDLAAGDAPAHTGRGARVGEKVHLLCG